MNPISILEKLPGMISHDKVNILLVSGGLKPSSLVVLEGPLFTLSAEPTHIPIQSIQDLENILIQLKLSYVKTLEVMDSSKDTYLQEVMRIFIAKDTLVAQHLKGMFDDIKNHNEEVGLLLGYPLSAVQAFLTDDMLNQNQEPISTDEVSERNMRLLGHRLSKTNWRNEVKYLETVGNYIASVSPLLYNEATQ